MAHLIDTSTGRAAIAYVGQAPWHKLGARLEAGASLEEWRAAAGLGFCVEKAPVLFQRTGANTSALVETMKDRNVLYRSDTGAALSVVSNDYRLVQPAEVLDFFGKLAALGGFTIETAGALAGGRKIWALAKVNDGAPVIGHDVVRPYVLLATSFDGTLATTAKFTAIRVVCNNTLTMSVGGFNGVSAVAGEESSETGAVVQSVRVPHSQTFDADKVRLQLGIVDSVWERWLVQAKLLAKVPVSEAQADTLVFDLLSAQQRVPVGRPLPNVRASKGYGRIMSMFSGSLIGADLAGKNNAWVLLNAITEEVDHYRGKSDATRMDSAWFGSGEGLKQSGFDAVRNLAVAAGAMEPA